MFNRRHFIKSSCLVPLAPLVPSLFAQAAQAARAKPDARSLVVIQLDGGNDGINTVVPYEDDGYARSRNKLRLSPDRLHKLGDSVGLHRSLTGAKALFDEGRLAIVQGVGYPNPSRSHFRSMRIWHTARFDEAQHDSQGWLGRTLDIETRSGGVPAGENSIYVGDQQTPVALWGRRSNAIAMTQANDLILEGRTVRKPSLSTIADSEADSLKTFVSRQVFSAYEAAERFQKQETRQRASSKNYPSTALAESLQLISKLIQSGSQARVFYTIQAGYDTHSAQLYPHARLLSEFGDALKAFLDDLTGAGLSDRVVVFAFSEFGRRVEENDSQGTDHGTAGPVFLAGDAVAGGLMGAVPSLTDLEEGDLKVQTDFRRIYATLLDEWLGVPSKDILGPKFENLNLFAT
jgi:uncharacterized protein (DUF1501 family)